MRMRFKMVIIEKEELVEKIDGIAQVMSVITKVKRAKTCNVLEEFYSSIVPNIGMTICTPGGVSAKVKDVIISYTRDMVNFYSSVYIII